MAARDQLGSWQHWNSQALCMVRWPTMKRAVIAIWPLCLVLAALHLFSLAGDRHPPGFWIGISALLACYSLPFLLLCYLRSPGTTPSRTLFVIVFAVSLWIPVRRFLPGYRPVALEGLAYFFLPILECGLILLFIVVRAVVNGVRSK